MSESTPSRFSFHRDDEIDAVARRVAEQHAAAQRGPGAGEAQPQHPAGEPAPQGERAALYVERTSTRVRVYTPSAILEGDHHHAPGVRLSDALRNQVTGEKYMLLTNVEIRSPEGVSHASFVLISSAHASIVLPLDEQDSTSAAA